MVVVGKVKINAERTSGKVKGDDSSKTLKGILDELKNFSSSVTKFFKLGNSGLFSAGTAIGGGIVKALASTAALTIGAGAALAGAVTSKGDQYDKYGYEKVSVEGQEYVAMIDEESQKIIRLLTMQEAANQGILDETDNIRNDYKLLKNVRNSMLGTFERQRDVVLLELKDLERIMDSTIYELELNKEIVRLKELKIKQLEKEVNQGYSSGSLSRAAATYVLDMNEGPISQQRFNEVVSERSAQQEQLNLIISGLPSAGLNYALSTLKK